MILQEYHTATVYIHDHHPQDSLTSTTHEQKIAPIYSLGIITLALATLNYQLDRHNHTQQLIPQ